MNYLNAEVQELDDNGNSVGPKTINNNNYVQGLKVLTPAQVQKDNARQEEDKRIRTSALQTAATNRWWRPKVDAARFTFVSLNFILSVVFAFVLISKAFYVDDITELQVFHTDRVLQSPELQPPAVMDRFVKEACGAESEILGVASRITEKPQYIPHMYEVSGSNSMLRLEAVHSSFMLFSALWISSAFSLAMAQLPGQYALRWSTIRVAVVHVWNAIGLVLTVVIFTGTTKWSRVPLSNLFYSLVGQSMAWVYQYFHMVECTQSLASNDLTMRYVVAGQHKTFFDTPRKFSYYSTELRKLIYMEFSVVAPMFMVASIMPGMIGIDEWRVQTVLFSSWTLFALLGLHLRFRKELKRNMSSELKERGRTQKIAPQRADDDETTQPTYGYDALGYLTYAIVVVFMLLINAMGRTQFYDAPHITPAITSARWAARVLMIVSGVMVLEAVVLATVLRFWPSLGKREMVEDLEVLNRANQEAQGVKPEAVTMLGTAEDDDNKKGQLLEDIDPNLRWSFAFNILIIGFGSVMVKILVFAGLSNGNALSHWS